MTIEYKPVHSQAETSNRAPTTAIAMRPHSDAYDQPIDPNKNYPCVTFDLEVCGVLEIRTLIDSIISDHGKAMVHAADGKKTIWRIA